MMALDIGDFVKTNLKIRERDATGIDAQLPGHLGAEIEGILSGSEEVRLKSVR